MTPGYRWHGIPGEGESMHARRQERRDEARARNAAANAERKPCLHVHGDRSEYARTVCGVK